MSGRRHARKVVHQSPGVRACLLVVGLATVVLGVQAQQPSSRVEPSPLVGAPMMQPRAGEIEVVPVRGNVFVLTGAGANVTASVGPDGVLLVDAGTANDTGRLLTAIQQLEREVAARGTGAGRVWGAETRSSIADRNLVPPAKAIRYIVNTHAHPDHTGGNAALRRAGRTYTGGNVAGDIRDSAEGAAILAHERVLLRMSAGTGAARAAASGGLPTETYYVDSYKLSHFFNGEGVRLVHMPAAHTDGDSIVHFRGSDVLAVGDLMSTATFPVIAVDAGGTINGVIDALNRILDLAIAEFRLEGGTMIVPGHGRVVDSGDVAYYRDMTTIIRDRILDMVRKGMTLEQVKAAKPAADYEPRYGSAREWTTAMFVEAVYRTVQK